MYKQKLTPLGIVIAIFIVITTTLHNGQMYVKAENGDSYESAISPGPNPEVDLTITPAPNQVQDLIITPGPNQEQEPTVTPGPIPGQEPTGTPAVTPVPEPTITPEVTPLPEPTVTPQPVPTANPISPTPLPSVPKVPKPTKAPQFVPGTLKRMQKYDYVGKSVTGISQKKISVPNLQKQVRSFGTLYGTGMPLKEFQQAMRYQWVDVTEYNKTPIKLNIDLTKSMDYNTYVNTMKLLSRYEGVYLYHIGKSTQGRDLYAIEIDVTSTIKKEVFLLTGQVHAREFAGGTYLVKQFVDLVQKAQTDSKTMELLKKNKYVAVPIINVDGREGIIKDTRKWTTSGGLLWKAYANGTDGGRNFPGLQWGQVAKGNRYKLAIATKPGFANYPGTYAGSNSETKAMMKWLYHYIIVEQAAIYLDLHQQGSIIFAGKPWQTVQQEKRSLDLRTNVLHHLNRSNPRRRYVRVLEDKGYGLNGEGSSLTDYAMTLAVGAKFSPAYGFSVFTDGKKEYLLMEIKDLDRTRVKVKEANKKIAALTLEIGVGIDYLGDSFKTRQLIANEYKNYHYDKLLEALPGMVK